MTRIKVCCISSIKEALLAIEYGASALGLVSSMPSGPGVIEEKLIAEIAESVPPGISTFLLTSRQSAAEIIEQQKRCRTNTIQLCDRVADGTHKMLRDELPGIKIVQVIHVTGRKSVEEAVEVARNVDAILLDSGNQNLKIKELGGTGRIHDWSVSRVIRENVKVPVFLAGGLNSSNVYEAVRIVKPYGLDLCSGVRTGDRLDENKLKSFVEKVFEADKTIERLS
ncbi:MAG TPA: phosphoribosylanthranilate isomerase [Melioribacteraceae bacterium]|nr:phosphoribosylanthranilate isomerase [Melioribacteraceae bacterium]